MDLANEEMKRTRNQRKPRSVVDKMRRTSEGISPTQVVMTSQFDVERIKGVYDDDSPVSDQEDQVCIFLLDLDAAELTCRSLHNEKSHEPDAKSHSLLPKSLPMFREGGLRKRPATMLRLQGNCQSRSIVSTTTRARTFPCLSDLLGRQTTFSVMMNPKGVRGTLVGPTQHI